MNIVGNEREMKYENNSVTEDVRCELGAFLFPKGSTIFPKIGGAIATNKKRLTTRDCCVDNNVMGVVPRSNKIDSNFLYYFFLAHDLSEFANEAHLPSIRKTVVESWPITLPASVSEQQRIVGILDEAFAGIATAKANAEKNLQNARAIFKSQMHSVFAKQGDGWVEKSLGEICEMYQPKTIGMKDLVPDGPYPVFGANGVIGRYDKFNHAEPQLLVTCRGATCGAVNVSMPKSWITGNAMVIRPKNDALNLQFLEFVFRGGVDISKAITGAAQPQITRTNLSPILIRFPISIEVQGRLAEQFENIASETQRLESLYQRKLAAFDDLKQSLLHQAFSGGL